MSPLLIYLVPALGAADGAVLPPKTPACKNSEGTQLVCPRMQWIQGVSSAVCETHVQICARGTSCPLPSSPPFIPACLPACLPTCHTTSPPLSHSARSLTQRRAARGKTGPAPPTRRCARNCPRNPQHLLPNSWHVRLPTRRRIYCDRRCA